MQLTFKGPRKLLKLSFSDAYQEDTFTTLSMRVPKALKMYIFYWWKERENLGQTDSFSSAQCEIFTIFLSLISYMKSILRILEVQNQPFKHI